MDINYNTEKLIILNYPPAGGGKFLSLCLGLHPKVLPQDAILAKEKMLNKNTTVEDGYNHALYTFKNKKPGQHFEYSCHKLAGFNCGHLHENPEADVILSNDFWKELTNHEEFYFFMSDHPGYRHNFKKYINRKTIYITNYNWLLELRNSLFPLQTKLEKDTLKKIVEKPKKYQMIDFDIETVQKQDLFYKEIDKVLKFLGLSLQAYNYLEELRLKFLQTLKIGFEPGEKL